MIKDLEIWNFQGHENTLIEFDEGVNIIKGRSHSGKSSIIRALIWALQNRPSGFHFKSHFAKKDETTDVSIQFDDGTWISRQRHNKFNGYLCSGAPELEALRTDIPEEIKTISQLSNINIQSQADKYFLLQESPGYVAKVLNNIVGLDIIDEVNKKVSSIIKQCNSDCVRLDREIAEKKEELEGYKHLDKIEKLVNQTEKLITKKQKEDKEKLELELLIDKIFDAEDDLETVTEWLEIESLFKRLKRKSKRLAEMKNKHVKLEKLYNDVQNSKKSLKTLSDTLRFKIKQRSELLKQHSKDFCSKCGAYRKYWRKK